MKTLKHTRWRHLPLLGYAALGFSLVGCGAAADLTGKKPDKKSSTAANSQTKDSDATQNDDIGRLEVLAPGELARKIYDAFGPGMTLVGQGDKAVDYLDANSANFIGSISSDPNNKYASSFSIGYFMALAGLSTVVGQNYSVAIYSNRAIHDCRTADGAEALLKAVAPTMTDDEAATMGASLVAACSVDPASAAEAVVQSYSTALKSTF